MTEYQKIAIGLLGLSHPEIYLLAQRASQEHQRDAAHAPAGEARAAPETPDSGHRARRANALVRGVKFAFAALLTGSRIVPLGDNRRLTKQLGAYGARLRGCD
jgi:hypothetical protein